MLYLGLNRGEMAFVHRRLLLSGRTRRNPALATVVADAIYGCVVDHRRVVNVVNFGDVHVIDGTVVVELTAIPAATLIALAEISVPIVNATIEANDGAPEA